MIRGFQHELAVGGRGLGHTLWLLKCLAPAFVHALMDRQRLRRAQGLGL